MSRRPPDEHDIIRIMIEELGQPPQPYSWIGDDVAYFPSGKGVVAAKIDMFVSSTDMPPRMTLKQAARKSVVMCVSDFAAKGVAPTVALLSLGIPRSTSSEEIRLLARGFSEASREFSLNVIGGDTNEAESLTISCAMMGFAKRVVKRDGAKPGDIVATTGSFGNTAAGLKILLDGLDAEAHFKEEALSSVFEPGVPIKLGCGMNEALLPSASMDSSDGLAITLHEIASRSGVSIRLDSLPTAPGLESFAKPNGLRFEDLVLYGGEEYEIVYTFPKRKFRRAASLAEAMNCALIPIGRVLKGRPSVGFYDGKSTQVVERRGWTHLRSDH